MRRLADDRGIALVMALGILVVMSIVTISLLSYTTDNVRSVRYQTSRVSVYSVAEGGLNEAYSVLFPSSTPLYAGLLPSRTSTYDRGSATWSGSLETTQPNSCSGSHTACWVITSTGTVANPTGGSAVTRTLTSRVAVDAVYAQPLANPVYDYVFVYGTGDPSGCDFNAQNTSDFTSALYVQGNLCLSNSAIVRDKLQVWGTASINSPQSSIGTSSSYDTKGVHVAGGCRYSTNGTGPYNSPCSSTDQVWADPAADASPVTLSPPVVDFVGWYKNASPGPYGPCTTSSGTPGNTSNWATAFDGDQGSQPDATKMNRSVPGTFNLTPSSSYSCKTAFGELSYDAVNHVLTVKGTVFIDGNARVEPPSGITVVRYTGVGSIYLSGSFVLKGASLCAAVSGNSCDWSLPGSGHWDVANNFLDIVAGGIGGGGQNDVGSSDISVELVSAGFQGAVTAALRVDVSASSSFQGPLVERSLTLGQSLTTYPFGTLEMVPTATPGNPIKSVSLSSPSSSSG